MILTPTLLMVALPLVSARTVPVTFTMPFCVVPAAGVAMDTLGPMLSVTNDFDSEIAMRPLESLVKSVTVYVSFAHTVVSIAKETAPVGGVHT
ncbi:unannotated protein [freshwater metagenome]|uniref:Unannotated protein n=1 Tax=freshwater metagenome TaxID=449393 RepID=A0A6J7VD88_9ZZZZ